MELSYKAYTYRNEKGPYLFFAGWSQCSHPCATANVFLYGIKRILQRGYELLWKTSKYQINQCALLLQVEGKTDLEVLM